MGAAPLQEYLFQRIREKLPETRSLADAVADLLCVSNDSAYRRIRGETPLVLNEAQILCDAFSISLDEALQARHNSISFSFTRLNHDDYDFGNYLMDIHKNLLGISQAAHKHLIYLTKDIPIFYNFLYPPLFAFRYFFWMKSILQHPGFVSRKFSMDILPKEIEALGRNINQAYNTIPSTEIWNTECVNSTIAQIEYYREADYFQSESDISIIYRSLRDLVLHLRSRAETGRKFMPDERPDSKPDNFDFYHNRVVLGDNTILVMVNHKKMLYLTYDVLNYMITQDEKFCNGVHEKLQTMMRRATLLSNESDKQRNIFFNILLKKIPGSSFINQLP